jgi:methylmalonyl-CoA mutase cobalamin-binding domain/chain
MEARMPDMAQLKDEYVEVLLADDPDAAIARAREILDQGMAPLDFFQQIFTPAMQAIGDQFGRLEIFMPELMMAADSAKAVNEAVLKPLIATDAGGEKSSRGTLIIGSVLGDLHDIGKNMVSLMLQVNGFDVVDMGVNVPPKAFIDRARETGAIIVGLSSLMTTSMPYMREVVEMRDNLGLKNRFAVIVGGAPITAKYCEDIGADAFALDAVEGVRKCIGLINARGQA